jgi:competence protein ComEA
MTQKQMVTAGALLAIAVILTGLPVTAAEGKSVVNINTAGVEQLMFLPRIGPSVAQRIVDFRESNGRFKTVEELMLVRGIGEKTFELIKPHVAVAGDTTLTEKVPVPKRQTEDS